MWMKKGQTNSGSFKRGRIVSDEVKKKLIEKGKNRKLSTKTKNKLRDNAKINPHYGMKGKHHTEKTKKILKEKRAKQIFSIETRNKKSKQLQEQYNSGKKIPYWLGKKRGASWLEMRKNLILPVKDTSIELKLQSFLTELKVEYLKHQYMDIPHGYQCDILIPIQEGISKKTIIEAYGDYWHSYPLARPIDNKRCKELREAGWRVLVFWECEIKEMNIETFKERLLSYNKVKEEILNLT